ncbi:hypothetical protein WS67_09340 [Burkholderia singularis]|uniref:Uncharacterized protein n=1 Tax=Burkholderia singularis TaxID=1503053 RepID=A0A103E6A2_9BURK|nr:hypothetical protein WS67_09340 [Burkholderia singularis]
MLVDQLPWAVTFGSRNVDIALYNGGTLYLGDGTSAPGKFDEISPDLHGMLFLPVKTYFSLV